MDPLLIAIIASAAVALWPTIKKWLAKLNQTDSETSPVVSDLAAAAKPYREPSRCVDNLMQLAQCLPPEEREALVKEYAAGLVLKEME